MVSVGNKDQQDVDAIVFRGLKVTARLARTHRFKAHAVVRRQLIVMRDHSRKTFRMAFARSAARASQSSFQRGVATRAALRVRHGALQSLQRVASSPHVARAA